MDVHIYIYLITDRPAAVCGPALIPGPPNDATQIFHSSGKKAEVHGEEATQTNTEFLSKRIRLVPEQLIPVTTMEPSYMHTCIG